ncbi:MAG: hypothetical protein AAFX08_01770 [Pseudomonadota bacterium]
MKINIAAPGELSSDKLRQIFEFRYRIYIDELGFRDSHADHESKIISDDLDPKAYHFYAEREQADGASGADGASEIVGVGRFNVLRDYCNDETVELFQLKSLTSDYLETCLVSTMIMVTPDHRGGTLPMEIAIAQLKAAQTLDVDWCVISCHFERKGFFQRIGFEEFVPESTHPDFGRIALMKLNLRTAITPDVNAPNPDKEALLKKRASLAAE